MWHSSSVSQPIYIPLQSTGLRIENFTQHIEFLLRFPHDFFRIADNNFQTLYFALAFHHQLQRWELRRARTRTYGPLLERTNRPLRDLSLRLVQSVDPVTLFKNNPFLGFHNWNGKNGSAERKLHFHKRFARICLPWINKNDSCTATNKDMDTIKLPKYVYTMLLPSFRSCVHVFATPTVSISFFADCTTVVEIADNYVPHSWILIFFYSRLPIKNHRVFL